MLASINGRSASTVDAALREARTKLERVSRTLAAIDANIASIEAVADDARTLDHHDQLAKAQAQHLKLRDIQTATQKAVATLTDAAAAHTTVPLLEDVRTGGKARAVTFSNALRDFIHDASRATFKYDVQVAAVRAALEHRISETTTKARTTVEILVAQAAADLGALQQELLDAYGVLQNQWTVSRASASTSMQSLMLVLAANAKHNEEAHQSIAHVKNAWQELLQTNTELVTTRVKCLQTCIFTHVTAAVPVA